MNNEHREMLQDEIDIGFALDLDLSITNLQEKTLEIRRQNMGRDSLLKR